MRDVLVYLGAAAIAFWGIMHIVKTRPAIAGFGVLTRDNRRILMMEWILEGVTLCFVAVLVSALTALYGGHAATVLVDRLAAALLFVMATVSLFTGARVSLLPYKLCPPIFASAALLFLLGSVG